MKVLWVSHLALPIIQKQIEPSAKTVVGGWMQGACNEVLKHKDDVKLSFCFQYGRILEGSVDGLDFFSMPTAQLVRKRDISGYREEDFNRFKEIVEKVKPDIIHVFGTESFFQRQIVKMAARLNLIDRTVIWIQGMVSVYSRVYGDGLSIKERKNATLWEFLRGTNVEGIKNRLALNGIDEERVIKLARNVFVRTCWDSACCKAINPDINLRFCNETLRAPFYEGPGWSYETMNKHTIFVSQYYSAIKGFFKMLEALKIIKEKYPDTVVMVTGADPFDRPSGFVNRIRKNSAYYNYIKKLIDKYNLKDNVRFLGNLDADEMKEVYSHCNVFVSPSSIENSPNSVGEAMILGVPVISSDVGGVTSMVTHGEEGLLYPYSEVEMLASYVSMIFESRDLACRLSEKGREKALKTHASDVNYQKLIEVYNDMLSGK